MPKHRLTQDENRKGALAAAQAKRERRTEAELAARERIVGLSDRALDKLEALLESEEDSVRFRVIALVLDRVLGRPTQAVEIGWPRYFDPSMLDDDELDQLRALLEKSQPEPGAVK